MGGCKKKAEQLGMPHGTACNKLRKLILFRLIQQLEQDACSHCGKPIVHADQLSIEHIKPWLDAEDPKVLFWDLNNIRFSHTTCNYGSRRNAKK